MPYITSRLEGDDVPLNWDRDFVRPTAAVVTEIRAKAMTAKGKIQDAVAEVEEKVHQLRKTSWDRILDDDNIPVPETQSVAMRVRDRVRKAFQAIHRGPK